MTLEYRKCVDMTTMIAECRCRFYRYVEQHLHYAGWCSRWNLIVIERVGRPCWVATHHLERPVRNTSIGTVKRPPIRLPVMEVEGPVILTLDLVNVTV
jgi:hypothetical protein